MALLLLLMTSGDLNDAALLLRIATESTTPRGRDAQTELYQRHAPYLRAVLAKRSAKLLELARQTADDLVQDTFARAFERAHTFDAAGITDPDRLRQRTRGWLGAIAQRLLADVLARPREDHLPSAELASPQAAEEPITDSPALSAVVEALATLSEREQDVLRVSALYHRVGDEHQRLPNAVASELAQRWGVSPENVRAIRSRAMKKLRASLTAKIANHTGQP